MDEASGGREEPANPFRRVRVRWFVVLDVAAAVAVVFVLLRLGAGHPAGSLAIGLTPAFVALVWMGVTARVADVGLSRLLGPFPDARQWVSIAPVLLLAVAFYILFDGIQSLLFGEYEDTPLEPSVLDYYLENTPVIDVLSVTVAPFVEELSNRGMVLHRWEMKWGRTKAIVGSSILFSLAHFPPFSAFLFGIVASFVYLRTGSLWPPILLHMLVNLAASLQNAYLDGHEHLAGAARAHPWIMGAVFAGVTTLLVAWMIRNRPRGEPLPYFRNSGAS